MQEWFSWMQPCGPGHTQGDGITRGNACRQGSPGAILWAAYHMWQSRLALLSVFSNYERNIAIILLVITIFKIGFYVPTTLINISARALTLGQQDVDV